MFSIKENERYGKRLEKNIKKEVFTPKKYIKKWLPVRLKYNIKVFIKKLR